MASYAALLSLYHTLDNIKKHPSPPICLDQSQADSLTQNLTFFLDFLENHSSTGEEDDVVLESRIAAAAYTAEDVIETHIADQIHRASSASESISSVDLYGDLNKVIQDMDLIRKEVVEIIQHHNLSTISSCSTASGGPASTWHSSNARVFDDAMINQVLDSLTGQQGGLQIIPVVGMGGIGKTTFARYIYTNSFIIQHFDNMAWVTISQEYSRQNILQVLCQEVKGSIGGLSEMNEDEIGEILYKHLCGRRYLIVMDDIWSVDAWYRVKPFFPVNNDSCGSRIMMTTRLSNLAIELSDCHVFHMQFLEDDKSWDLLCEIVFAKLDCPIELKDIGREIARKCRGLPLSIAVIGGLLKKSNMTREYWIYTLENLNLMINLENDEYALRILGTSYKELPMHLKPCFLYIGVFPEDAEIKLSMLVKLWVAEGILKPINDKSLEEVGKEYLKELILRNLILISKLRRDGNAKLCKMHDLLRVVCLREAQKQKFFCLVRQLKYQLPHDINMERRICIDPENAFAKYSPEFIHAVESASLNRSLLFTGNTLPLLHFRLLRIYSPVVEYNHSLTDYDSVIFKQSNLRYLTFYCPGEPMRFYSLCTLFWNLQTLMVYYPYFGKLTFDIWEMPLLRHVLIETFVLLDPYNGKNSFVLKNLQTLSCIMNFKCSEEVVKRIPNLKKLKVVYCKTNELDEEELPDFCLINLGRLQKLEYLNLYLEFSDNRDAEKISRSLISFPQSLKKLSLSGTRIKWEELTMRMDSLPLLQFLILGMHACVGAKWETVEGKFCSLRVLRILFCQDQKYWETDNTHFPCLEILEFIGLTKLEEIPSSIGDIPTLKSIKLEYCSKYAGAFAKRIIEEQKEYGNEDLNLQVENDFDTEDEEDSEKE